MIGKSKTWKFKNKKEAVEFFVKALTWGTTYPKTVELIQPNKVRIIKMIGKSEN